VRRVRAFCRRVELAGAIEHFDFDSTFQRNNVLFFVGYFAQQ
jgi:hypothetical protein